MPNYLAITLGPVYKTILQARSTREIWASSYIFSIVMREIVKASSGSGQLLSPLQLPDNAHRFGAGIYPDRAFWLLNNKDDYNKLQKVVETAFSQISDITKISERDLSSYIRLYAVKLEREDNVNNSIILELNKLLDILELQEKITNPKTDLLAGLVTSIQSLYKDGHQQLDKNRSVFIEYDCNSPLKRLPSLIELATADLKYKPTVSNTGYNQLVTEPISREVCEMIKSGKNRVEYNAGEDQVQENIIQILKKEYKKDFRFRHKYIAFIKADGDYMGYTLGAIGNYSQKIIYFSELLSAFTGKAAELIVQYGGLPIYAGGDDLLFTVPLVNSNEDTRNSAGQNIFELINKIDEKFPKTELAALVPQPNPLPPDYIAKLPSLSYGISFSYFKYPLDETLQTSNKALYIAKDFPGKNAVAFKVRKHSGQTFNACFSKQEAFKKFFTLLSWVWDFKDDAFLTSVMYKLAQLEPLVSDALINDRLEHFFKNQFNEKDHADKYNKYLKAVRGFAAQLFEENRNIFNDDQISSKETIQTLYACLRFVQFINQEDHE